MNKIAGSLAFGFFGMLHGRMLWLIFWPMLVALVLWITVLVVSGAQIVALLSGAIQHWLQSGTFFVRWDLGEWAPVAVKIIIALAFVPLVWMTALLILSVFGMNAVVDHVAQLRYPQLARRRGGSVAGSVANGLVALAGMAGLAVLSLPLWLLPPLWPVIPVLIMAWVNQRVLRYDALAEHATAEEMRTLFAASRNTLYGLGVGLALLAYIPVLGFFAPVWMGLAFAHYLLGELRALREAPIEGSATTVV
jgi:CysZ protein